MGSPFPAARRGVCVSPVFVKSAVKAAVTRDMGDKNTRARVSGVKDSLFCDSGQTEKLWEDEVGFAFFNTKPHRVCPD